MESITWYLQNSVKNFVIWGINWRFSFWFQGGPDNFFLATFLLLIFYVANVCYKEHVEFGSYLSLISTCNFKYAFKGSLTGTRKFFAFKMSFKFRNMRFGQRLSRLEIFFQDFSGDSEFSKKSGIFVWMMFKNVWAPRVLLSTGLICSSILPFSLILVFLASQRLTIRF